MKFTKDQKQVIETRNKNILVSAAAGSGKTSVLVERILSMITDPENPVDIDRFLIVTFTNAAASEMRERIHRTILERLSENPEDANLQKQSALIHNAQITTIDSFCLFLLKNHFHEIGLDPAFRIGDPGELKLIEKEVLEKTLEGFYEEADSEFLYFTDAYCPDGKDGNIEKLVEDLYRFSTSHPWPSKWLAECEEKTEHLQEDTVLKTEWMQYGLGMAKEKVVYALGLAVSALQLCEKSDGPYMYAEVISADIETLQLITEKVSGCTDADSYGAAARIFKKPEWRRLPAKKDDSVSQEVKDAVKDLRERYKKLIANVAAGTFGEESLGDIAEKELEAGRLEKVLIRITRAYAMQLEAYKKEKNVFDFSDIEHYALNILVQDEKPTQTAEMYRDYYETVMIDEYQDSNMVQEWILSSVSKENNRFMVGDMKQSIYRFRMARPEIFMEKYDRYKEQTPNDRLICLKQNFRSRSQVLDSTNAVFKQLMHTPVGGVEYDDDAALYFGADYPEAEGCDTQLCVALARQTGSEGKRTAEAYMIAKKIKELKAEFKVSGRQLEYRDIVILLRSGSDVAEKMKDIFMSEGIPAYVTSKTGYFSAREVSLIMNLLKIMNNPYDDIAFCAVATSLFFGMTDEELALITARTERGISMYQRFLEMSQKEKESEPVGKVSKALTLLDELRRLSVICSMTELINEILTRFHYVEYVSALPAGEQRKANVEMFIQKAVDFEKTSYHGLFHFLRYMEQLQKYEVDFGEASTLSEAADVVRIMTIHKSKGLEFPVCFVAGLDKQYNMRDTSAPVLLDADWGVVANRVRPQMRTTGKTMRKMLFASKMKRDSLGEELRVLYVAMTRAKEKLILTAAAEEGFSWNFVSGDKRPDYLSPETIESGKSPLEHLLSAYSMDERCFGVQLISEDELERGQVRDIAVTMLRKERAERLAEMETAPKETAEVQKLKERFSYIYPHEALASLYTKTSVSELKHAAIEEEGIPVLFETEEKEENYLPAFMRQESVVHEGALRGSAMHRLLELLDFSSYQRAENAEEIRIRLDEDICRFVSEGRMPEEYGTLVMRDKIAAFLQSDLAVRMAAAQREGELYKEQPFVMAVSASLLDEKFPAEEKVLIQGIIDAYFEEEGAITILDYKTDRVSTLEELKKRYKTQLDYYEEAVGQLTGKPVREKVLYSFALMDWIGWKE